MSMGETVMQNEINELRRKFKGWEPDTSEVDDLKKRVRSLEVKLGKMRKLVSNYLSGDK